MNRNKIIEKIFSCPKCKSQMYISDNGKSVFCRGERRHCYDFSADGYLALGQGRGDSKEAVRARTGFLDTDAYKTAAESIVDAVKEYSDSDSVIIDAGCGEGYYTNKLANICGGILGVDLSKFACGTASKRAKREGRENALYATGSVFELPVADGSADVIVNIFAPCAEDEYARALKDGGYLVVVGAGREHLMGLKTVIYDNPYENEGRADLPKNMTHIKTLNCKYDATVEGNSNILALFSMTPYYWRTSEGDKQKLEGIESLETTVDFEINIYRK